MALATEHNQYNNEAPVAHALRIVKWCPLWPALLLITLFVPTELSFTIGSLRITPYRVVLLLAFIPGIMKLLSDRAHVLNSIDFFIALHLLWGFVVFWHHHGGDTAIESGGIRMLEMGGGYLVARVYIINERGFRGFIAILSLLLVVLVPFVIFESISGTFPIKTVSALIAGSEPYTGMDPRHGFYRALGPFDHPILLGVFAASAVSLLWMGAPRTLGQPRFRNLPALAAVAAALSSVSTGALAALAVQLVLLSWEMRTRHVSHRWLLLFILFVTFYFTIDTVSNRSGIRVFFDYLAFNAQTANYRIAIYESGLVNIQSNPVFGIGFNDWVRPVWMYSNSIDNFWLLTAMVFGIPGFVTFVLPFLIITASGWRGIPSRHRKLRLGWAISLVSFLVAGCTVHFWNNLFVYLFFFLGAGVWFLKADRKDLQT
ncbi:MAG: O-antigen ligase family protein [Oleiphilaceae bacterium]|nr:O-antigen ligase family protein [Oleiphilaceae bacterium]